MGGADAVGQAMPDLLLTMKNKRFFSPTSACGGKKPPYEVLHMVVFYHFSAGIKRRYSCP